MDTKALIEFLKENLQVKIRMDTDGSRDINVFLILCGEEISKDWISTRLWADR
jgi:hypothetical protein